MQNSNYVVLIDENGQPYLAHSIWDRAKNAYGSARSAAGKAYGSARSAGNRAVKYIEKIGDGAKARYFYTQDELKAYYNKGKNAAKNAANKASQSAKNAANKAVASARDAIGITDREKRDAAIRKSDAAFVKHFNAQQRLNNAKLARDFVKDRLDNHKGSAEEYLDERKGFIEKAKRALSADARDRDTKMREEYDARLQKDTDAFLRANDDVKLAEVDARMKQREYEDASLKAHNAQNHYEQTPLGFITDVIPDTVDRAKEAASDAADRAKEAASDAVDRTKTAASKALDFVNAHQEDRWADSKLGPLAQKAANLSEKVSEVQLSNQWAYDPNSNELVTAKKRTEDLYNSLDSLADKYTSERNPIKRVAYQREMERMATELNDIYEDALKNK